MTTGKRLVVAKGKGYLNATGPQARFIIFLILVLIAFTLLLRVFQKLSEILQLPIFLPISLVVLFIFIAIVGILYSHRFLGPVFRIQKAVEQMAEGELMMSLRLRDSDDPLLKELAGSVSFLCEHYRKTFALIQAATDDISSEISSVEESVQKGADAAEVKRRIEGLRSKQAVLERAVKSFRKG